MYTDMGWYEYVEYIFSEMSSFEWWIHFEYVWRAEGPDIQATQRREGFFSPENQHVDPENQWLEDGLDLLK